MAANMLGGVILIVTAILVLGTLQGDRRQARAYHTGPCGPDRVLRPAVPPLRGPDVMELQDRLRELGFYRGPVDGVYTTATVNAVKALQEARGKPDTGEVDDTTWSLMADNDDIHPASRTSPPPQGALTIRIDLTTQTLTILVDGKPYKNYTVAIGKPWTPSPPGEWKIVEKAHESGGAFGTRWLGLDVPWGSYGLHGTNRPWSIGRQASAGCVRMHNPDVEEIFTWVDVGIPVTIHGPVPEELWGTYRPGSVGLGVVALQWRLREAGFDPGRADGRFGQATGNAIRELQAYYGLPGDGTAGGTELYLLGLRRPSGGDTGAQIR